MHLRIAVASLFVLLATAASAAAQGDPTMPLGDVRQGMKCTAYSVIHGTDVTTFDAEVLDIVGGDTGARILVKVSGPAVDETGIGAGFSGSPIYCKGSDGVARNAGAISETIGDYGGKTVLVTPIEAILGTAVDPPAEGTATPPAFRNAHSLAEISVRGLSSRVFNALQKAGRRNGRTFIQGGPVPFLQGPAPAAGPGFRPGSAVGVGLSSGGVSVGAIGTVAYVDGDKVWLFGHQFDGVGRRSLLLQDAYVAAVINNPVQLADAGGTYKLAGAVNDRGLVTNDGFSAVAGRLGGLPTTIPVHVVAKDLDSGRVTNTDVKVADETDIGTPTGTSSLSFVAPLAVTQAATGLIDSTPIRIAGEMCLQIRFRERPKPVRFCNRYVSDGAGETVPEGGNLVGLRAGSDVSDVMTMIDSYRPQGLHVTEVSARVTVQRGQRQAYMRGVTLPKRVRPGQRVRVKMKVRMVRGATRTLTFPVTIPRGLGAGERRIVFKGSDPDTSDSDLFGTLTIDLGGSSTKETQGPQTLKELVAAIRKTQRYDGIKVQLGGTRHAYREPQIRIGGRAATTVVIKHR